MAKHETNKEKKGDWIGMDEIQKQLRGKCKRTIMIADLGVLLVSGDACGEHLRRDEDRHGNPRVHNHDAHLFVGNVLRYLEPFVVLKEAAATGGKDMQAVCRLAQEDRALGGEFRFLNLEGDWFNVLVHRDDLPALWKRIREKVRA